MYITRISISARLIILITSINEEVHSAKLFIARLHNVCRESRPQFSIIPLNRKKKCWKCHGNALEVLPTSSRQVKKQLKMSARDNNQNYRYYKNHSDASLNVRATSDLVTSLLNRSNPLCRLGALYGMLFNYTFRVRLGETVWNTRESFWRQNSTLCN